MSSSAPPDAPPPLDPNERRQAIFRASCNVDVATRIARAVTQRLFLVHYEGSLAALAGTFTVLGSTGNVYKVSLSRLPRCDCPDAARGNHCKHLLFVYLKVLRVPSTDARIWQRALLGQEVADLLARVPQHLAALGDAVANDAVQRAVRGEPAPEKAADAEGKSRRQAVEGEACPICFDDLTSADALVWCQLQCGKNFHDACMRHWIASKHGRATCPNCRHPWNVPAHSASAASGRGVEGYVNLGALQGQGASRDTSTYTSTWGSWRGGGGYRRRRWRNDYY